MTSLTTSITHYCDPLSNNNVVGFVNPKSVDDQLAEKSVIIAGSRVAVLALFVVVIYLFISLSFPFVNSFMCCI